MAGNVPRNANQPVNPNPSLAWRARKTINLVAPLHALPQNVEKELPKFDLRNGIAVDDHLQSFYFHL